MIMELNNNSLIESPDTFYQTPMFSKISVEEYKPAIEWAIGVAKSRVDAIVLSDATPSFESVILPLELSSEELDRITSIFFNMEHAHTSERMQELAIEISPLLSEYSNSITLNEPLFNKVKLVHDGDMSMLDSEQKRVVIKCFKLFERSGANLSPHDKIRYREIQTELSKKAIIFGQNVLGATNDYYLHITDKNDLMGLPDYAIEGAAEEAKERSLEGWVITLQAQSMLPFMQYCENRSLREVVWRKYASRCYGDGQYNNEQNIIDIVNLRLERAKILGYETHADYILEERMAGKKEKATSFLADLLSSSLKYGKKDIEMIENYAHSKGFEGKLFGWDFSYYSEQYKSEILNLSDEELKPYFELEAIETALFNLSTEMYGIRFEIDNNIDKYHKDVKVYRVIDLDDKLISILYVDFFPRATKSGGAWMTTFRDHYRVDGEIKIPIVSLVCNFTKPTATTPALLTFNEVTTLFHEFGHALHGIFAKGNYPSITGTNVAWDFVELPSQIMENWATERVFLERAAKHYKTGEVIPPSLVDRIISSRNFLSGYSSVRQLSFGIGDMGWHTITEPFCGDVKEFESLMTKKCQLLPKVEGVSFATAFSHIFSGGYSAGYYSYKWAEVLEADAFTRFQKEGVLNPDTAKEFRDKILSKGDSKDAMELYVDFMGREPNNEALLIKLGLIN